MRTKKDNDPARLVTRRPKKWRKTIKGESIQSFYAFHGTYQRLELMQITGFPHGKYALCGQHDAQLTQDARKSMKIVVSVIILS